MTITILGKSSRRIWEIRRARLNIWTKFMNIKGKKERETAKRRRLIIGVFFVMGDIEKNGKSIVFREIRGHPER